MRSIVVRADADGKTGYGHFVRSGALAAMLRHDFRVRFATYNADLGQPTALQKQQIAEAGAEWLEIDADSRESFDAAFLEALDSETIAVLDNYYFTTEYQQAVRSRSRALLYIDDMHLHHSVADVVMTFCPMQREDFSLEPYTRFYGGIERAFLREPFLENQIKDQRAFPPRKVLVMMGGADPLGLTDKFARIVSKEGYEVLRLERGSQLTAREMRALFDAADVAILPTSTVCVEAFSRRLPVIGGYFVDNQRSFYDYSAAQGYITPIGDLTAEESALEEKILRILGEGYNGAPEIDFVAKREETIEIIKSL